MPANPATGHGHAVPLLDRLIGWVSPGAALRRHFDRVRLTRAYLAAAPGDTWRPRRANASANADHQADAPALRAKSRFLIQNVDYIAAGMNARVAHIVGTGITVKWGGQDGKKLAKLYAEWSRQCDADGRLDLFGMQAAAVRAMDSDGAAIGRLRTRRPEDGLAVPLQVQLLEVDWLDTTRQAADNGNVVTGGKEYDALGRCVAYWLWDQHPGDVRGLRARGMQSRRVPADQIIHLYAPLRPGQADGFPRLSPVITRARDLQLLEDAELQRKNLEGRLSVLASGDVAAMANAEEAWADATGDLGQIASGGITRIPPGLNLTVVEPKAAAGFVDYCRYNIHHICAGAGFTYEQATGDMREVNYSSARVRLLDFRREIEQLQWHTVIPSWVERICHAFAAAAALAGKVRAQPQYTIECSTPKWDYVNPADDVQADLAEISGGLASFSEKLRRRGYDPEQVYVELASDIERLKALGVWEDLGFLLKGRAPSDAAAKSTAKPTGA